MSKISLKMFASSQIPLNNNYYDIRFLKALKSYCKLDEALLRGKGVTGVCFRQQE